MLYGLVGVSVSPLPPQLLKGYRHPCIIYLRVKARTPSRAVGSITSDSNHIQYEGEAQVLYVVTHECIITVSYTHLTLPTIYSV